jgi:hypothetical protein
MNLQDLGNLGEFVGAMAVVVSLAYLALQVRQNTRASRAETYQNLSALNVSTMNNVASSPEHTRFFNAGLRNFAELDEEDKTQFSFTMHCFFTGFQNAFYLHRYGNLERELWEQWRAQLGWYTQRAGVIEWWELSRYLFSEGFQNFVNELMASRQER